MPSGNLFINRKPVSLSVAVSVGHAYIFVYGKYSYTASIDEFTWSGNITLDSECFTLELDSKGFANKGSIAFWMGQDPGFIPYIELEGNGFELSGTLSMFFPSGTPTCGANGTVTFANLPYGTYDLTLSAAGFPETEGYYTVTLDRNCLTVKLDDLD